MQASWRPDTIEFHNARAEHAWLLRAEGLKLREIGDRLGITRSAADILVRKFGRRVNRAMRHTRDGKMARMYRARQQWLAAAFKPRAGNMMFCG